jgi:hypothetical protein
MRIRLLLALAALGAICTGFSCDEEPFGSELVPPPLDVTSLVPADSARVNWVDPVPISITFNRVVDLAEIRVLLVPPPVSTGELRKTGSGRNVTWFDVLSDPDASVQRMLLDGRYVTEPMYVEWYTQDTFPRALFAGTILSEDVDEVSPKGAVVFALDGEAPFNPLQPSTFAEVDPVGITVVESLDTADGGIYVLGRLVEFQEVLVVCVVDTSGDARYDPAVDWWGYFGEGPENTPETVVAGQHPEDINAQVDILLRPPR